MPSSGLNLHVMRLFGFSFREFLENASLIPNTHLQVSYHSSIARNIPRPPSSLWGSSKEKTWHLRFFLLFLVCWGWSTPMSSEYSLSSYEKNFEKRLDNNSKITYTIIWVSERGKRNSPVAMRPLMTLNGMVVMRIMQWSSEATS